MKKWLLWFLVVLCVFMVGCTNVRPHNEIMKSSSFVDVEVNEIIFNGIGIKITNKTDDFVEIVWDSSNLNDYPLSFGNNLVTKALEKKPNTSIEPNGIFKKEMYIPEKIKMPAKLLLKLTKKNVEEYVSIMLEDRGEKIERKYNMWTGEWESGK